MRILIASATAAILIAAPAHAQKYRRFNIITGGAYTDRADGPDRWKVMGTAERMEGGQAAALYRAAEVTAKAGSPAFRIVKQKVQMQTREYRATRTMTYRETASLTIRAVRVPADLTACEMPLATQCMTMTVQEVMARFGPELDQPARPLANLPALAFEIPRLSFRPRPVPRALPAYIPPAVVASRPPMPAPYMAPPSASPAPVRFTPAAPSPRVDRNPAPLAATSFTPLPGPPALTPLPDPPVPQR
jgi:hypothetical protein